MTRGATRESLAGLVFLSLAMCGAPLLVATLLFGAIAAAVTATAAALAFGVLWFALPLWRSRLHPGRSGAEGPERD